MVELKVCLKEVNFLQSDDTLIQEFRSKSSVPLIGESIIFRYTLLQAAKFALSKHEFPILIVAETGTGKELIARAIHDNSKRAGKVFFPVNCSAIPDELFESEVFGHTRGAFTGASSEHVGYIATAGEGTLFLDEIGDLTLPSQIKMLRALSEERQYRPVGSSVVKTTESRIITATNQDLGRKIKEGQFRQDLYYRLETFILTVPSLRERAEDIPLLIDYFLSQLDSGLHFSKEALDVLYRYPWPGNVRELQSLTRRLVAMYPDDGVEITPKDLNLPKDLNPEKLQHPVSEIILSLAEAMCNTASPLPLRSINLGIAAEVVRLCGGNKTRAARILSLNRTTLHNWFGE